MHIPRKSLRFLACITICLTCLFLLPALSFSNALIYAQDAEPISIDAYYETLLEAAALLEDPTDPVAALLEADALLTDVRGVRLDSGAIIVPRSVIDLPVEQSADEEADVVDVADPSLLAETALLRIQLLIDQIERAASDNTVARIDALDTVFARPEFAQGETLWQRFINWIDALLERFFPDREQGSNTINLPGEFIAWSIAIVGLLALVFLLSYWFQGLFGSFVTDATTQQQDADGRPIPLTAFEARQQASQLAQAGDYRDAVRSLYLSSLLSMEESGMIRYDRSLTNREVLNQVNARESGVQESGASESVEEHLRPVVDTFDAVWYGVREPDAETFQSYENEIDGLADIVSKSAVNKSVANTPTADRTDDRARDKSRRS